LLSHEAIQPTFCTRYSVSCVGNRGGHPTVATYASSDHKFNAEPSSPLSLHHRWISALAEKQACAEAMSAKSQKRTSSVQ
jgi:hypothetical protein